MQTASGKPISSVGVPFETIYPGTSQKVAFTGTSAQSAAFGARTSVVRVTATQDCHITAAATAVGDGTAMFLPKGTVEKIGVAPGSKLAVIQDSSGGNLFITEGA